MANDVPTIYINVVQGQALSAVKGFGEGAHQARRVDIFPGLCAVVGDEGTGKTALLTALAATNSNTVWLDHSLPDADLSTPLDVWQQCITDYPQWDQALARDLASALDLDPHAHKLLSMLSTGSRRKVGLVVLLASGATVTCLDQPFGALDRPSIDVLRGFFEVAAHHSKRAWVIADYEADPHISWQHTINL
jgi:ABC-type cobalamin/Fe3+-siderophores transport system ATPase subunit